jgi:hypothetical protein
MAAAYRSPLALPSTMPAYGSAGNSRLVSMALRYVFPKNAFERDCTLSQHYQQSVPEVPPSEGFAFPTAPYEPFVSSVLMSTSEEDDYAAMQLSSVLEDTANDDWSFIQQMRLLPSTSAIPSEAVFEEECRQLAPLPPLFSPSPPRSQ